MTILGLDTATRATTVALWVPPAEPIELRDDPPRGERPRHTTHLLPMAAELLERAETGWDELERIAVGVGPGTFTGLRVGIATARALGQARRIPVVGVCTLRALAMNVLPRAGDAVLAVLDARRGEAFAAAWGPRGATEPILRPAALAPERLSAFASGLSGSPMAIGEGAIEFRGVLEQSGVLVPEDGSELHRVTAINHCRLAREMSGGLPADLKPLYLRAADAEIALARK